jgi:hypothetical protein
VKWSQQQADKSFATNSFASVVMIAKVQTHSPGVLFLPVLPSATSTFESFTRRSRVLKDQTQRPFSPLDNRNGPYDGSAGVRGQCRVGRGSFSVLPKRASPSGGGVRFTVGYVQGRSWHWHLGLVST